jgi:hypothetical protein
MFSDDLGGVAKLPTDEQATRAAIQLVSIFKIKYCACDAGNRYSIPFSISVLEQGNRPSRLLG